MIEYRRGVKMKKLDIYKLITAVLQLAGGLALIGISVYYYFIENTLNFYLFLIVGIIFVVIPVYSFVKAIIKKDKKDDDGENDKPKRGFL